MAVQKKKKKKSLRIGVVVSLFNEFITTRLLDGCMDELVRQEVKKADISVVRVPGAFEIPVAALKLARKKDIAAVICLGAVIRGETLHFELVSQGAAQGIQQVALTTGKPILFGVLTTETVDQAYKRSEPRGDNKGKEAAEATLAMIRTLEKV